MKNGTKVWMQKNPKVVPATESKKLKPAKGKKAPCPNCNKNEE